MEAAERLLDNYAGCVCHVHVSSLDGDGHHLPLRADHEALCEPTLGRCLGARGSSRPHSW